jgi:hypothetical protein
MAKISTYPIISEPTLNDLLIGTDVEDLNITKNFTIGDIASLIIGGSYVPYIGATENVDLGAFDITSSAFIVGGGLATQFLKADGSLDATIYQPAGNYITQLSGEATASGPGNATVTLSNSAVINKVLTGLNITGAAIVATDSILTAFGKVQNQINTLVGGVQYKGTWNAATNTPTLVSSVGVQGNYYVVNVAGNTNLNGITDWNLGDWAIFNGSAWEKVDNTDAVISVNGQVGAVVLTTTNIAEGTNLYYTDLRARSAISLTTTGNSGASTYSNLTGILNVPNYTLAGLGGVPLTRELTINGTTFDLSANRSWSVGTVTSISTTGPLTGGTITGSGTIGITQSGASSDGYLSSTDWNTFNNKQNALTNPVTGTGTIFTLPMWSGATSLADSPLSYGPDAFNFQYNSATGGTVNFTNIGLTPYTYAIQMNNFGSPRSTVHSYTDGVVVQFIGGTQVSRVFANGNFILGTGVVDNGYKLEITGNLYVNTIANAITDTDRFIVSDGGVIKYRTGAEILSDIGAQGALTLTTTGTSGAATLISNVLNIPQYTDQFVGTVTSVGLSMPPAFTVSNSPVTSAGTLTVVGAGNATQYVRGDGALATLPTSGTGGGASVSYYLNGSVNQGTIGGVTYYEMNRTPIIGAGTDFTRNTNGYISSFLTDAGDPALLAIPAGNWNFETYFSASSGGGSPTFYLELYKYDGTTFTLIASNSGSPKLINDGTNIEAYFSALAVPQTTLTLTDRLAIRIYVNTSGRTITLHTENGHLCQVITTFTTGLTALNGLTSQVQYFATGTAGTNFNILSAVDTHTFNLPTASAVNRGALSSADWTTFNSKIGGTGTSGQVAFWNGTTSQTGDNGLFWDNTNKRLGVGGSPGAFVLDVNGTARVQGVLTTTADAVVNGVNIGLGGGAVSTNLRVGASALNANTIGSENSAFGTNALFSNTTGNNNTGLGTGALQNNATGGGNTAIGRSAGRFIADGATTLTTATNSVFIGFNSRANANSETNQIAIGHTAIGLGSNTTVIGNSSTTFGRWFGNLLIGTSTNSTFALDVNGTARVQGAVANALTVERTTATSNIYIRYQNVTNSWYAGQTDAGTFGIGTDAALGGSTLFNLTTGGNLLLGSLTNSGQRLQVTGTSLLNGLSTIQGTTASDSGQLGAELLTTGTGDASWTGTSFATGYTHVAGSTTTLTSTLAGVVSTLYQITYTVTGRTAGSFAIDFGGATTAGITATGAVGPRATTTGTLVITPTSDFNGTIVLSIRVISFSSAVVTFNNSSAAISNQIRISNSNTNTFIGFGSGRNNTTGVNNSLFGSSAGASNTTGNNNSFFGIFAGNSNTTGASNSFFGASSGQANTTGGSNSFFGQGSGISNSTGASNSFFGTRSGELNSTGGSNSFFGVFAGFSNTTGGNNSFFGINSGFSNTTGVSNCFFGINAGRFLADGTTALTIANDSVFIGANTRANANNQTNQIVIGITAIGLGSNTTVLGNTSTTFGRWFGNLLVGTSTNSGQMLQVTGTSLLNGLSTIQGTTASDTAPLGSELATTGTGTNWAGTDFATGYTHTIGSTAALTTTLAAVVGTYYQITFTVTGRTTGSFVINYGGITFSSLTATGAVGPRATSTATLEIVPTTDFNGTIVLSIRVISASSASVTFTNSSGNINNEIRNNISNTNTFIGFLSGRRNTTGTNNTFIGQSAGQDNTTGGNNTFVGQSCGVSNTTGASNSFFGRLSGQANTIGIFNSFFGSSAGASNTTGNDNSFFGRSSGIANTTGASNSFFGASAGAGNTTGGSNAFFGASAGAANTTGGTNSFFGQVSGFANTTGSNNSFFGTSSGQGNTTGASNSFFGVSAGLSNTTASSNSFFGENAGLANTTGANNIAFGRNSGRYAGSGTTAMTSVNNSIYLGFQTRGLNATGSTNEVVIGYDVVGLGSNTTVLGNSSTTFGRWYGSLLLGTTTNAASSILTMESTTQGFLPPRMTAAQRTAIASPAEGLIVYQTDSVIGLYIYANATWRTLGMI